MDKQMRLVEIDIKNFRGIEKCTWHPSPNMNCLIGPGDSTKTTILDAIELVLRPRQNFLLEDSDFFNCKTNTTIEITATVTGLPSDFLHEDRYGLYLRGWNEETKQVIDEPSADLVEALSIRCQVKSDLEVHWSIFNDRITKSENDPPIMRFKDAQLASTVRLGPYADHHLSWSRQSALSRLGEAKEKVTGQLALAVRAAREAFRKHDKPPFVVASELVEKLSQKFSVGVRSKYTAALDFSSMSVTNGGISLHDGDLPLRRLGTGSSRLLVAAIQHNNGTDAPFALIDEIEQGLEPHRLARLIKLLKEPDEAERIVQSFCTTHSLVAIREMAAGDLFCVRSSGGTTTVRSTESAAKSPETAQRHIRQSPDAFLAPKVIVCEGATEQGMLRALDELRSVKKPSFALQGVIAIDGRGNPASGDLADHLAELGHRVFLFLDGDKKLDGKVAEQLEKKTVHLFEWPDDTALEDRLFSDLRWDGVKALIALVTSWGSEESVRSSVNVRCEKLGTEKLLDLSLPANLDSLPLRNAFAQTAKDKDWFKSVSKGEELGRTIQPYLKAIESLPLVQGLKTIFGWVDGK